MSLNLSNLIQQRPAPHQLRSNPLYRQVKDALLVRLGQGEWPPGSTLPSEIELAREFSVSQGTVRKAIDELAAGHLLIRRQGRGTYVATHLETKVQFRFLRIRADHGEPVQPESKILSVDRVRAPAGVAQALALKQGDTAIVVKRVLSFAQQPAVLDVIWLPQWRFRGLTFDRLTAYSGPLYGMFETEFKTRMIRCEERLKALAAQPDEAEVLGISAGEPVLVVERISFSYEDEPVELRLGYCLTRHYHYVNQLT
jgi:GntR family transcriptional regulator